MKQSGEFGLSVGDVARLVSGESLDDLAETGEGEVDTLALCEGVPGIGADTGLPWDHSVRNILLLREQGQNSYLDTHYKLKVVSQ